MQQTISPVQGQYFFFISFYPKREAVSSFNLKGGCQYMVFIAALLGLLIGSFLNVCIWRLPRSQSIILPGSYCPGCGHALKMLDLIPLLSFALNRCRCRYCFQAITWRYPVIELLTATVLAVFYTIWGWSWVLLHNSLLFCGLLAAAVIDIELRVIPNRLLVFMTAAVVMLHGLTTPQLLLPALGGGISAGMLLLLPALLYPGGMGGGDIKLAAVIGLYLGWPLSLLALLLGIASAAVAGLGWMLFTKQGLKTAIPLGPFLGAGAMVALLWGHELLTWYLGLY
jgi:leader peptidase (prepilin peptidase)/N-methyltransferase